MKKIQFLALFPLFAMLTSSMPIYASTIRSESTPIEGISEIPVLDPMTTPNYMTSYKDEDQLPQADMLTEDQAKASNVPEGYSGYVLKLTDIHEKGWVAVPLDLGDHYIHEVESINIRIFCSENTDPADGIRLADYDKEWIMRLPSSANEQWADVVISNVGPYQHGQIKSFDDLDDGTGHFKPMQLYIRIREGGESVYIDSISFKLKEKDTEPPKIEWDGNETINTTAGKPFSINAKAYDEYYKMDIEPEYIWSEGAIDENGLLLEGDHTCTIRYTDPSLNASEINIKLHVAKKDTDPPVLSWAPDHIAASAGMKPVLSIIAKDAVDGDMNVDMKWSDGALSATGRLNAGEHTLTLTAFDRTGNKVEKIIRVTVSADMPTK